MHGVLSLFPPHLHGMVVNSAQKQIFLKTETSSSAKKNSYCNRNYCKISVSQSSDTADYNLLGCHAISVIKQSSIFFRC